MEESGNHVYSVREDEEISLIDILAVLARYRKLVMGLPLLALALAGLYLAVGPKLGIGRTGDDYTVLYTAELKPLPSEFLGVLELDEAKILDAYFSSLQVHLTAYRKTGRADINELPPERLASYVKEDILGKRFKASYDKNTRFYSVSLRAQDQEEASRYLEELWSGATAMLRARGAEAVAASAALVDKELAVYRVQGKFNAQELGAQSRLSMATKQFTSLVKDSGYPFNGEVERIVYLENQGSTSKTLILVFLASGFIALLGAFFLNAVRNIRQNPEAMAKLRNAWHGKV